ncbi:MAG TPA: hypothetical protein VIY48_11425, partial [Candidatus Paceibacterota bacterium]
ASLFGPPPEDKGVTGHVMDFLSYLNAPNRALYGGFMDPEGFWEGAKKGWQDKTDYSLADLIGLQKPGSEDDWFNYIAKGIPYLVAAGAGDPLNLLFAPAKAGGIVGRGIKALGVPEGRSIMGLAASPVTDPLMEKIAGSGLWKALVPGLPETGGKYGAANQLLMENLGSAKRVAGEAKLKAGELADVTREALEKSGLDPLTAQQMFERNIPDLAKQYPDVYEAMKGQHAFKGETFGSEQEIRKALGMEPKAKITEDDLYTYWARVLTPEGQRAMQTGKGSGGLKFETRPGASRELLRITDPEALAQGELKNPLGLENPVVTKKDYLEMTEGPGGQYTWKGPGGEKVPVGLTQASLEDITKAGILKPGHFLEDPATAMQVATEKDIGRKFFLESIGKAIEAKEIVPVEEMTSGMRVLEVPGLKGFAARKSVANMCENLAHAAFDPNTPIGAVGDVLQRFNQSWLGEKLGTFTDLFKATTLPLHPGFHAGNAISNEFMMYANGGVSPLMIPVRNAQAIAVATGKGADIIPQLKEAGFDILHEAKIRDLTPEASWFGSTGKELASKPGILGKA